MKHNNQTNGVNIMMNKKTIALSCVMLFGTVISAYSANMSVYVQNHDPKHTITVKEVRYNKMSLRLDSKHTTIKNGGRIKVGKWNVGHANKNNWSMVIQVNCSNKKGGITPIKICYAEQCAMSESETVILNIQKVNCRLERQMPGRITATSEGYIDSMLKDGFIETILHGSVQRCHPFKGSSAWC